MEWDKKQQQTYPLMEWDKKQKKTHPLMEWDKKRDIPSNGMGQKTDISSDGMGQEKCVVMPYHQMSSPEHHLLAIPGHLSLHSGQVFLSRPLTSPPFRPAVSVPSSHVPSIQARCFCPVLSPSLLSLNHDHLSLCCSKNFHVALYQPIKKTPSFLIMYVLV